MSMHINDGSSSEPRLVVYAHSWALQELPRLPHERAWSFEEALERVAEAGYDGVQAEPERGQAILSRGLRFAAGGRANTTDAVHALVQRSVDHGAECLTLHLGWGDEDDDAIDRLVFAVLDASQRSALPAYIETHRATVVQDLWRTRRLIKRIPEIQFNGDYSHYYCAHEVPYRGLEPFLEQMQPVLERTCFFHGRVSNGQSMQVSIADEANRAHVEAFTTLWRAAVRAWQQRARPGDILPFVPELGPPSSGYAIPYPDADGRRAEIADRWEEMVALKNNARALD